MATLPPDDKPETVLVLTDGTVADLKVQMSRPCVKNNERLGGRL
jgi:hypothetical protein